MGKFWLKMIGTHEKPCPVHYSDDYVDSRKQMHRIQPGDWMILYAVGRGKRLFAHAQVIASVQDSGRPDWPYRVKISYDIVVPVVAGIVIDEVVSERNLIGPIQHGASYIELKPEEYAQAKILLEKAAGRRPA